MASVTTNTNRNRSLSAAVLLAPFKAVARVMVALAEASPQMRALSRLSETSDEELAARGLTRDGEIRRILGGASAI
ncbi:MAG: DUF1127 domain-containing protein [Paracoccus sp. (in: a-proteobacteria)]|nr:DUF1127 domain-containing protein [Paracoccus sp. (in: a-proteobacteria)]